MAFLLKAHQKSAATDLVGALSRRLKDAHLAAGLPDPRQAALAAAGSILPAQQQVFQGRVQRFGFASGVFPEASQKGSPLLRACREGVPNKSGTVPRGMGFREASWWEQCFRANRPLL